MCKIKCILPGRCPESDQFKEKQYRTSILQWRTAGGILQVTPSYSSRLGQASSCTEAGLDHRHQLEQQRTLRRCADGSLQATLSTTSLWGGGVTLSELALLQESWRALAWEKWQFQTFSHSGGDCSYLWGGDGRTLHCTQIDFKAPPHKNARCKYFFIKDLIEFSKWFSPN